MNKKLLALIVGVIFIASGGVAYTLMKPEEVKTQSQTAAPISSQRPADKDVSIKETDDTHEITKEGVVGCLQPKQTDGPQTMECAIGMKDNDGKSYGLQADDPMLTGSVPTGTRIRVTGVLITQSNSYDAQGIIRVRTLKRL